MIKKITLVLFICVLCCNSYLSMTYSSGPPDEKTNAPGEGNCTDCHSGSLVTSGSDWNRIQLISNFTGGGYIPDSTYTLKITYSESGGERFGFEATILDSKNNKAGSLSGSGRVQKSSTSSREYVLHTSSGSDPIATDSTAWTFSWTAPSKNVGPVKLYMCLNSADDDNSNSGDVIYSKTFTINPSSLLPVASASGDDTTCSGVDVALNGSSTNSATSWSWQLTGATPSTSTSQNPTVKYSNAGTYWAILTSKNNKGFSLPDSLKIVVNTTPNVSIAGSTSYTICKGDSVKLDATFNSNYTYKWSPGGATTNSIYARDTGSYYVTATDKNNKCNKTAGPVKVSHHPSYTVTLTRDISRDSFCGSANVKLTANSSATFDTLHYYMVGKGIHQRTSFNPVSMGIFQSGKLYVVGKDSKGCLTPNSDTLNFIISPNPSVSLTGTSATICRGDSVKLTAVASGGSGGYSYKWSLGGFTSSVIQAKDSGIYRVWVTDVNKCTDSIGAVKISHHPTHVLSIVRDVTNDSICLGKAVKITGSSATATFDSLFYYTSSGLFLKTINNPETFNITSNITFFARGKDSKKCLTDNSNSINFVVKHRLPGPTLSCLNKTTTGFEIAWTSVSGATGYRISLDSGKTYTIPSSGSTGLTHKVTGFAPSTDVLVWVKALDNFPCNESPVAKIVCGSIQCSPLNYNVIFPSDVCKGDNITFKIRNLASSFYSITVDGGTPFKDTVVNKTATATHVFKFELTDSANLSCPNIKRDASVKVWEINSLNLSFNPTILCEGFPAVLNISPGGMQQYDFYINGVSKQKNAIPDYMYSLPKNQDSAWAIVTNGACVMKSNTVKLDVKPLPKAAFSHTFSGRTISINSGSASAIKYIWDFGDGASDTAKNPTHLYSGSAQQTVWVKLTMTDKFGCMATDSFQATVPAVSISSVVKESGIKIYPQPAGNSLFIGLPEELINAEITITDNTGRLMLKTQATRPSFEINTSMMANGVYFITVSKAELSFKRKMIVGR